MTEDEVTTAVLSVGTIIGGLTVSSKRWRDVTTRISNDVTSVRSAPSTSAIRLNVEFHVPGNLLRPEFSGVRTGTFRKKDSLLKVQVALPDEPPVEPYLYLRGAIVEAIDALEAWAVKRRMDVDTTVLRSVVDRLPSS